MPGYGLGLYGLGLYGIGQNTIADGAISVSVAGTEYPVKRGSFRLSDKVDEASRFACTLRDDAGTAHFHKPQSVVVADSSGTLFSGEIATDEEEKVPAQNMIWHSIDTLDPTEKARKRTLDSGAVFGGQYTGIIAARMIQDKLVAEGITANYALRYDDTQANFNAGTLSNVVATSDGNLELAPAGTTVTITETTTAHFSAGSLTNCTSASNSLAPTATSTIKLQATESLTYDANAYIYFKIFESGSINIISGRYLEYDIWINSDSPEICAGVDIIFTDGSTLRDAVQDYRYYDDQNIRPHPNQNQSGFANGAWRHRSFLLDNFIGKTISHVDVAIEGDGVGTYTAYFKNILETNGSGTTVNTFFNGTLNTKKQMQNSGYSNISLSVVSTYDCGSASQRVSSSTSVSAVDILKSSIASWDATEPEYTLVRVEYSLDAGNSYTECINGEALPNLPAGLDLGSKSIQFRQTFLQLDGASPESKPILNSMTCAINTSYVATKSDVTVSACTSGEWSAGTLTNTQTSGGILQLTGDVREWSEADLTNMTIYGGGAGGTGPTTVNHHCNRGVVWIGVYNSLEGRSRLDFAGTWANGVIETDIYVDVTWALASIVYRTTGWSDYDANYAYAVEVDYDSIKLQRGSNSSAASPGTRTELASATLTLSSVGWHRLKVIFSGSSHTVYLDDVQMLSATDGTYTAAGYIGLRASNGSASAGYQAQFNNFGVCGTGLSGTWLSASQSLTAAGTYGGSVVSWDDVSTNDQDTTLLVESTINGGSSYQTVTNGGSIQNLTLGQSLIGVSVQFRITLTTLSSSSLPQIQYFVARVLGGFSSSGTRISPALDLSNAGRVGATLVAWNATTPASTGLVVATSPNGSSSWTNRSSGDEIAGINSQPDLMLDTFIADTHTSYTHAQRTGGSAGTWTWDTTNSRLSVTGGTSDMQLWTAISVADVDIVLDVDQADRCGVVWRQADASNFYELDIYDASSNAGLTNVVQLFKVVANVKTQIGSNVAIAFLRDYPKRFRVTAVGTAITISLDGTSVISTTDSALSAAGKVGIIEVSGIGRFYNLRIQGYGDNLSGIRSYTRSTLTSTDPTQTPQQQDLTLAALSPDIGVGSLIDTVDYSDQYVSDNFDDLSGKSDNYTWIIRSDNSLFFNARQTAPAPWVLHSSDQLLLLSGLRVSNSGDTYRNRQKLTGVIDPVTGENTYTVTRNNTGGFTGTVSQSEYAADEGGSGIVEQVEDVSSQNLSVAAAEAYGDSLLQSHGVIGRTINFTTRRTGLRVGQYLNAFISEHNLFDAAMLVTNINVSAVIVADGANSKMEYRYSTTAIEGVNTGSWAKLMSKNLK
jgi:hypothetical protein